MADISKITLPSGNTYDIKDSVARDMIAGGISFNIVWTATDYASTTAPTNDKLATIPAGVVVYYNNGASSATGTLVASASTKGKFYLVYSKTQAGTLDVFDEYAVITSGTESSPTYFWEKIGDTLIDLSNVVTNVTLSKQTDTVIGTDATFTITQPTISLATGATAGTGVISVATGITSATATGDNVTALTGLGTPSTKSAIGANSTFTITQPTITMALADSTDTGKVGVITAVNPTTTNIKATASGANTAWNSKDSVTAVTGVSATKKKLTTTSITGVSGSTNITPIESRSSQTTLDNTATATTTNTDWLKGVSVTNETLTIGAATHGIQTTYSAGAPRAALAVPTAASSATTVATGAVSETSATTNVGATIAIDASASATDTVIGTDSTFTITQPTIALATGATAGTGIISVATSASGTTKYIGGTASGANTAWNSKDAVTAVTGYASPTTDSVLGSSSTITVTPTTTNIKATASGANTAWNNKDTITVLKDTTDVNVTKG